MGYVNADPPVTSSLFGLLALRQQGINQAIGIRRVTPQVEFLLINYDTYRQKELEKRVGRIFTSGAVIGVNERLAEIIAEIEAGVTPERLEELTAEAKLWQGEIDTLKEKYG